MHHYRINRSIDNNEVGAIFQGQAKKVNGGEISLQPHDDVLPKQGGLAGC
jgi:hypothetical protein